MTVVPTFLTVEEVIEVHRDQIARYGDDSAIRDVGLLESAVAAPQATFGGQYLLGDLFEMAAALMYSLVQNHAFIDGNKRVETASALIFLTLNGIDVQKDDNALYALGVGVAKGEIDRSGIVTYLKGHQGFPT